MRKKNEQVEIDQKIRQEISQRNQEGEGVSLDEYRGASPKQDEKKKHKHGPCMRCKAQSHC
jgi:hypothetical protein